jgi:hypothetical protein
VTPKEASTCATNIFAAAILVSWSDGSKEVIPGVEYICNIKYHIHKENSNNRPYVKSVELLDSAAAKALYETNKPSAE